MLMFSRNKVRSSPDPKRSEAYHAQEHCRSTGAVTPEIKQWQYNREVDQQCAFKQTRLTPILEVKRSDIAQDNSDCQRIEPVTTEPPICNVIA